MHKMAAHAILMVASMQAQATIVSFSAPPLYPDLNASASFAATRASGNASRHFRTWEDVCSLMIDRRALALNVGVDVPQDVTQSLSVESLRLTGQSVDADLPCTLISFTPRAGLKRFEQTFDRLTSANCAQGQGSRSNASGVYYIRISKVPEPSAALLAVIGAPTVGWQCHQGGTLAGPIDRSNPGIRKRQRELRTQASRSLVSANQGEFHGN
jgi:hypothetical protein